MLVYILENCQISLKFRSGKSGENGSKNGQKWPKMAKKSPKPPILTKKVCFSPKNTYFQHLHRFQGILITFWGLKVEISKILHFCSFLLFLLKMTQKWPKSPILTQKVRFHVKNACFQHFYRFQGILNPFRGLKVEKTENLKFC